LFGSIVLVWYHPDCSPFWGVAGVFLRQTLSTVLMAGYWGRWQERLAQHPASPRHPLSCEDIEHPLGSDATCQTNAHGHKDQYGSFRQWTRCTTELPQLQGDQSAISAQSPACFDRLLPTLRRFILAQDTRIPDPRPDNLRALGKCRLKAVATRHQ
jgi:hypothetical protein